MKRLLLVLFLLPMFLLGTAYNETLIKDPSVSEIESYGIMAGRVLGDTIAAAAHPDTFYIKYLNVGKYATGSLFLLGDVDSMVVYARTAPTPALLTSFEWDSLTETAATDSILTYNFTGLNSSDYMDLMVISTKVKTGIFTWFYTLLK